MEIGWRLQIGRGLAWLSALWMVGLVGIFGAPRPWRALHGVGDDCDDGNHYRNEPEVAEYKSCQRQSVAPFAGPEDLPSGRRARQGWPEGKTNPSTNAMIASVFVRGFVCCTVLLIALLRDGRGPPSSADVQATYIRLTGSGGSTVLQTVYQPGAVLSLADARPPACPMPTGSRMRPKTR